MRHACKHVFAHSSLQSVFLLVTNALCFLARCTWSVQKFVQYVYKNSILQILGYINVVCFKILPIRHNTLVPPPFPLLEAPLEFLFS